MSTYSNSVHQLHRLSNFIIAYCSQHLRSTLTSQRQLRACYQRLQRIVLTFPKSSRKSIVGQLIAPARILKIQPHVKPSTSAQWRRLRHSTLTAYLILSRQAKITAITKVPFNRPTHQEYEDLFFVAGQTLDSFYVNHYPGVQVHLQDIVVHNRTLFAVYITNKL